jgi:hypothetical protein
MANFDAGNFNLNFGVGGTNRFQKAPGQRPEKREIEEPRDGVDLGSLPFLQVNPEILPADPVNENPIIAGSSPVTRSEQSFSLSGPLMVDAVSGVGPSSLNTSGAGITALNGINSTTLFTLGGKNIASVNAFNPVTQTRIPTTSVATNGLESLELVGTSGRILATADKKSVVPMPTTSIGYHTLEDTSWTTTSGRQISLG